jgi:hypothetical protein
MMSDRSEKSSPLSSTVLHHSHAHLHQQAINSPTLARPFGTMSSTHKIQKPIEYQMVRILFIS